jgi:AraC-like DNA-binding protein
VAVGAVVLNRMAHPSFPNTMSGVIYQRGAFSCLDDGQFDQPIADSAYRAARDALNGADPSGGAIYYFNPDTQLLERREEAPFAAEQVIRLNLEWMLIHLLRTARTAAAESRAAQQPGSLIREKNQKDFMDKVTAYLEANIHRRLTLEDVCRENLVGRSYLQKTFREKTGGGVMEYFGRLKMEAAKQMIRHNRNNFTEISSRLGYTSIHYFSRHFKKVTGMTPSEYASSVKILTAKK